MPMRERPDRGALQIASRACGLSALLLGLALVAFPQGTSAPPAQQANPQLTAQTNLVLVRVIVRDSKGNPVTGLSQRDFQVFDNKKQQTISYFQAEEPVPPSVAGPAALAANTKAQPPTAQPEIPQKFAALFFDNYHTGFGDLVQVREAARRYLEKKLSSGARIAIFSASGQPQLPFTTDPAKIEKALSQLRVDNHFDTLLCPFLPPYLAQLAEDDVPQPGAFPAISRGGASLQNLNSARPLTLAMSISAAQGCAITNPEEMSVRVKDIVLEQDLASQETLIGLAHLVQRMAETPGGDRTIAVLSDGFLFKTMQYEMDGLIEAALRANVVINALDTKGLLAYLPFATTSGSIPQMMTAGPRNDSPALEDTINQYQRTSDNIAGDTLSEIADGTGGLFVHNSNNMESGIEKTTGLNTPSYLLGFSPAQVKRDGRFHTLKVKLVNAHFSLQARRGYFAPRGGQVVAPQQEQMEQAVFSQTAPQGLPIQMSTRSTKLSPGASSLRVAVDADMSSVHFTKEGPNNADDVTVFVVVFDADGNLVTAKRQFVKLRLPDAALAQLRRSGGEADVSLAIKPGKYLVRAVMGESASNKLGRTDAEVNIP